MMKGTLSPSLPLCLLPSTYNDVLNQATSRLITTNTQFTDILAILTTAVTSYNCYRVWLYIILVEWVGFHSNATQYYIMEHVSYTIIERVIIILPIIITIII